MPGTVAYGANLFSALSGAVAVALVAWIGVRLSASRLGGLTAALVLAGSYSQWFNATHAEIYAFTLALSLGALAAYLEYGRRRTGRWLFATGLLLGAALGSHLSSLALAIVLGGGVLWGAMRGRVATRHAALLAAGALLGLLPLVLIPLRDTPANSMHYVQYTFHAHVPGYVPWEAGWGTRLERAMHLLSGSQYLEHGWFQPLAAPLFRLRLLALDFACNEAFGPALPLGIAGGWRVLRPAAFERVLLAWGAVLLLLLLYAANHLLLADFFLPGVAILALLAGGASVELTRRVPWTGLVLVPLLVLSPLLRVRLPEPPLGLGARPTLARVWSAWPERWDPFVHDASWESYARAALAELPEGAVVLHSWEEGTTFLYCRYALGLRPDVFHHMVGSAAHGEALVEEARARAAPVYTTMPERKHPAVVEWDLAGHWPRGLLWQGLAVPVAGD